TAPHAPAEGGGAGEVRYCRGAESEARPRAGADRPGARQVIVTAVRQAKAHPPGTSVSGPGMPVAARLGFPREGVDGDGAVLGGGGAAGADLFPVPALVATPVPTPANVGKGAGTPWSLAHGLAGDRCPRRGRLHRGEAPEQPCARLPPG